MKGLGFRVWGLGFSCCGYDAGLCWLLLLLWDLGFRIFGDFRVSGDKSQSCKGSSFVFTCFGTVWLRAQKVLLGMLGLYWDSIGIMENTMDTTI